VTPSSPPVGAPALPTAACAWAIDTLRQDAANDRAAAEGDPAWRDYYLEGARWWEQIAAWMVADCNPAPPAWPPADCADAHTWIAFGISTHSGPERTSEWDALWRDNYTRIDGKVAELCQGNYPRDLRLGLEAPP
jgi:hypothetical protein